MLRVRTVFTGLPGLPGLSTMFFAGTGSAAAEDAQAAVYGFWQDAQTVLSDNLTMTVDGVVDQVDVDSGENTAFFGLTPLSTSGLDSGNLLPLSTQACLSYATANVLRGRRVQGRTFIPGLTAFGLNEGSLVGTTASGLSINASTNLGALTNPNQQVVYSRPVYDRSGPGAPVLVSPGQMSVITAWSVNTELAVLRSRRD